MNPSEFIWMDGKLVKWEDAKVHVLTHSLHYANAVFEGTRAYMTDKGLAIFRLSDHTARLLKSAKMTILNVKYTQKELEDAQVELLRANKFKSNVYLRPIVYLGYGIMGLAHTKAPVNTAIAAWEWGAYLGEEGLKKGHPRENFELCQTKRRRPNEPREIKLELPLLANGKLRSQRGRLRRGAAT